MSSAREYAWLWTGIDNRAHWQRKSWTGITINIGTIRIRMMRIRTLRVSAVMIGKRADVVGKR